MVSVPADDAEEGAAERHAFVVVGMHRSGTSAMTRTLSLLGADLPKGLMAACENNNEAGFWEAASVAALNDEILHALDSEWDDVFAFRPRQYLSNFDRFYLGRASALLEQEFNGSEVIALKDPRISILMTFWNRALREAGYKTHYIVMVRNPLEVAESLRARDGFPREKSFLLWSSYMIAVERDTRDLPRTFVSYDQLMSDWRAVRGRLEVETGLPFRRDTTTASLAIDRYLEGRLRHHAYSSEDLFARDDVPEQVKAVYRIFAEACQGDQVDSAALEAIETELSKIDQIVGPLLADLKLSARALSAEVAELRETQAQAEDRAKNLAEQLERERAEAESRTNELVEQFERGRAEAESRTNELAEQFERERADNVAHLAAIEARASALENARNQICLELEDRQRRFDEINGRLATAEAEALRLANELSLERELRGSDQARSAGMQANLEAELKDQIGRHASLLENLRRLEQDLATSKADLERAALRVANSEHKIDELTNSLSKAQSTSDELESRLTRHFHETASLSRMFLESQQSTARESEKYLRVMELHDAIVAQPNWWSLLPKAHRSRLRDARLSRLGLFDAQSYLNKNPDVAAAGEDPVHHYIHHGIDEQRSV